MLSKRNQPTAAQRRWMDQVAQFGCVVTGADPSHCQLHHVYGFTYKHNKVLIGPWFILPLHHTLHDPGSDDPANVTHYPQAFAEKHGPQHMLFLKMITTMWARHDPLTDARPAIPEELTTKIINTIMATRK